MAAKRVIPCLDVKDARVVKGVKFQNLRDMGHPAELACRYDLEGADEVVFLDISATNESRGTQEDWVKEVAHALSIPFTVGGGVTCVEDVRRLLRAGADKVAINSAAVRNPQLLTEAADIFGRQCVVLAIDAARDKKLGWRVFVNGGKVPTDIDAVEWMERGTELGAGEILLTSIDRDGTLEGFDLELLQKAGCLPIPVIASGGAGTEAHFLDALQNGADAVLAATLFHEGTLPIPKLKTYLAEHGVLVRR
jgi:cyclase